MFLMHFFSFYGIIRDILKNPDSRISYLLSLLEDYMLDHQQTKQSKDLQETAALEPPSLPQKDGSDLNSSKETQTSPTPSLMDEPVPSQCLPVPLIEKPPSKGAIKKGARQAFLYPVLHKADCLDSSSEEELEEQAARYEREINDPPLTANVHVSKSSRSTQRLRWQEPFPYTFSVQRQAARQNPPGTIPTAPPLVDLTPLTPGLDSLVATKQALTQQIGQLKGVLSLQRELKDLTSQIQTLQADLLLPSTLQSDTFTPRSPISEFPGKRKLKKKPLLALPVMTRSKEKKMQRGAPYTLSML